MTTATRFTPEYTREILATACKRVQLDPRAELIRMGENALYRLDNVQIMARVGRSRQASEKEVAIAEWLKASDFPAATIATIQQPVVVDGTPVTFWRYIEESPEPVTPADLGMILRRLHTLPVPSDLALPHFAPMPKVVDRLAVYGAALSSIDRDYLHSQQDDLTAKFERLEFALDSGPIHGDAHAANLMRDRSGTVRLIDFEDFAYGPREWDVCVEAVRYRSLGWVTDEQYRQYVDSYGFDPLTWSGFEVVCSIRELNMTTWLLQMIGQSAEVDQEVSVRINDLRSGSRRRHWKTF